MDTGSQRIVVVGDTVCKDFKKKMKKKQIKQKFERNNTIKYHKLHSQQEGD